jgi:hypothetical protein
MKRKLKSYDFSIFTNKSKRKYFYSVISLLHVREITALNSKEEVL